MLDGYHEANRNDGDYSDLDELLTEYVDGTMDPVVREAFEQLMRQDRGLADHVFRLQETRALLCALGCQCAAPSGFQTRLRCKVACDSCLREAELLSLRLPQPGFFSAMAVALLFFMVGNTVYHVAVTESKPHAVETGLWQYDAERGQLIHSQARFARELLLSGVESHTHADAHGTTGDMVPMEMLQMEVVGRAESPFVQRRRGDDLMIRTFSAVQPYRSP